MPAQRKSFEFDDDAIATRGDVTRENLLKTAMVIFARDGFDAASTRNIADEAGVNQALISYHFKTKRGLYLAVFHSIVAMIHSRIGEKFKILQNLIASDTCDDSLILSALMAFTDNAIEMLVSEEMTDKAKLILREQQSPTEAFDIVYDGFMAPMLSTLSQLIGRLRPDIDGDNLKLKVIGFFSQVIALRAARSTITRFMRWENIGEYESDQLKKQIRANFEILIRYGGL